MEPIELTYHEGLDGMLYPDLKPSQQTHYRIGKYGNLHLAYLKAHRPGTYTSLLTQFRLNEYLHEIDLQAKEMVKATSSGLWRKNRGRPSGSRLPPAAPRFLFPTLCFGRGPLRQSFPMP